MQAQLRGYVAAAYEARIDSETGEPGKNANAVVLEYNDDRPSLTKVYGPVDAPGADELLSAALFQEVIMDVNITEGTWKDSGQAKVNIRWSSIKLIDEGATATKTEKKE